MKRLFTKQSGAPSREGPVLPSTTSGPGGERGGSGDQESDGECIEKVS